MTDIADTRTRIQQTALRLFTEQGYEATSLREIAEALGVTKAALYYHFRTKEDIVLSLTDQRLQQLSALLAWAKSTPLTLATRRELMSRYAQSMYAEQHQDLMRFFERNPTALRNHPTSVLMREHVVEVAYMLSEPDDPPALRLKRSMALFAMHAGAFLLTALTPEERREVCLEVAFDLISPSCAEARSPVPDQACCPGDAI
ncbi:DNA-binding transcriptional regulator, AcrR family [Sinosporangium album]|uniref:DNA-binding transcriptional regulator, AcrR family n=1 Tax=Sinosporangium album TaxID=504805 RepID=A0A1G7WKZ5_9ACTN|nr:TetR/AcrR family transcriptional regulator [Sinosporangium album]SDG72544.1 DNA-binding transcriptional regulator, AcrR family [Sinosporangium album]